MARRPDTAGWLSCEFQEQTNQASQFLPAAQVATPTTQY